MVLLSMELLVRLLLDKEVKAVLMLMHQQIIVITPQISRTIIMAAVVDHHLLHVDHNIVVVCTIVHKKKRDPMDPSFQSI